jgi:hypothetical protein
VFYYVGLDLGQSADYSALCVLEAQLWIDPSKAADWSHFGVYFDADKTPSGWVSPSNLTPLVAERILAANTRSGRGPISPIAPTYIRHLERFQLGTRYPEIVRSVRSLLHAEPFRTRMRYTRLLVDRTGVGRGVVDSFYEHGVRPISVTIHGGSRVGVEPGGFRVPKRDLVASVQVPLQNGSLKIAPELALADTLKKELLGFSVKVDPRTAHDSYEHWRENDHDDLVLATAMACWYQDYQRKQAIREIDELEEDAREGR